MDNQIFLDRLAELRDDIKRVTESRTKLLPLVADLAKEFEADARCTSTGLDFSIIGNGGKFKQLYSRLRQRGFKRGYVSPSGGSVTAYFDLEGTRARLYVHMSFPECKVVQVGTREVPVYQTICGGTSMPTAEELEAA